MVDYWNIWSWWFVIVCFLVLIGIIEHILFLILYWGPVKKIRQMRKARRQGKGMGNFLSLNGMFKQIVMPWDTKLAKVEMGGEVSYYMHQEEMDLLEEQEKIVNGFWIKDLPIQLGLLGKARDVPIMVDEATEKFLRENEKLLSQLKERKLIVEETAKIKRVETKDGKEVTTWVKETKQTPEGLKEVTKLFWMVKYPEIKINYDGPTSRALDANNHDAVLVLLGKWAKWVKDNALWLIIGFVAVILIMIILFFILKAGQGTSGEICAKVGDKLLAVCQQKIVTTAATVGTVPA